MIEIKCKSGILSHEEGTKIIVYKASDVSLDIEMVHEISDQMQKLIESFEGTFVSIVDMTDAKWVDGKIRIELGKRVKAIEEKYIERMRYTFMVVPNTVLKMVVRGINLVAKPKVPQKVFSSYEDALKEAELMVGKLD